MALVDYIFLAFGVLILLFILVHWLFLAPRQRAREEDRLMVRKISMILHLRGRNDLAEQVIRAKDMQAVEKICRDYGMPNADNAGGG